ncbi:MAG: hypothetical protein GPJ54_15790 [Candidatus Heimdallarchaeota archaeon]|nr:hypothetical protein [Candidatus Heimdallarchaeota archaeon]
MKGNYYLLLVFIFILIMPVSGNFPSTSESDNIQQLNEVDPIITLQTDTEPDENASIPFISSSLNPIELGNDIPFFYGMRVNATFFAGYNFSIYLTKGINSFITNDTSILNNYTLIRQGKTDPFIVEDKIKSVEGFPIISTNPQNYTLLFLVNSTSRGLLNATTNFEIVVPTGAKVDVFFTSIDQTTTYDDFIELGVDVSADISIILKNFGSANAFNITLEVGFINEPIGISNDTLPAEVGVLAPLEEVSFNFTLTPSQFGIGDISFELFYTDGLGNSRRASPHLGLRSLPNLDAEIQGSGQIEYKENEEVIIVVVVEYTGHLSDDAFNPLSIRLQLSSDNMTFLPAGIQFVPNNRSYNFQANPLGEGVVDIRLTVIVFDFDGFDTIEYDIDLQEIEFILGSSIDRQEDTPFSDYLPIIAIVLYFILILTLAILYYREDIRAKFFIGVLGLQILESIDYRTTSVIIDGSNIAWEQTNPKRKPMINNIIRSYKSLKENGFKKIVIIADAALRYQIDDRDELDRLVKSGFIKLVPAKVNADGFILRFSAENGYLILSNDLYKEFRDTYSWIDERRVPYTILDDRFYLHPTFE